MADINTYTAMPCPPNDGTSYEVDVLSATGVQVGNLAVVHTPSGDRCCSIDRTAVNSTPQEQAVGCHDSGLAESECEECKAKFE